MCWGDRLFLRSGYEVSSFLLMELVKAHGCCNRERTLCTNGVNRPVRIGPIVEWRVIRRICADISSFQVSRRRHRKASSVSGIDCQPQDDVARIGGACGEIYFYYLIPAALLAFYAGEFDQLPLGRNFVEFSLIEPLDPSIFQFENQESCHIPP